MERKRSISILPFLFLICTILATFAFFQQKQKYDHAKAEEKLVLDDVADRLGVSPDWTSVRGFVYCQLLQKGMTQIEVKDIITTKVGPFDEHGFWKSWSYVYYSDKYLRSKLSSMILIFDKEGLLENWGSGEGTSPLAPRAPCEFNR